MRASAGYRLQVARNLLAKALTEIAAGDSRATRVAGLRETAEAGAMNRRIDPSKLRGDTIAVGKALAHDSAARHVAGTATYVDDIREPEGTLHVAAGLSPKAKGKITKLDLSAVKAAPGVVAVLTAADILGPNECSPSIGGDPILADRRSAVSRPADLCSRRRNARAGAPRRPAGEDRDRDESGRTLPSSDGLKSGGKVLPDYQFVRGDPAAAIADAAHRQSGRLKIGGQEHFYLEGQVSLAVPGEGGEMKVFCSTQHPSEVQHLVARMLKRPDALVVCECRRMGGGFGGKESQAGQWACLATLAAHVTGRPAKIRLDRDDDMIATGKRHDFLAEWQVGP